MEVQLVILVICGIIAAAIASSKGRSGVGWFFIGFLIGIIGIIIICCLSNLNEDRNYKARVEAENRRLREQVYQERVKADSFRSYTQQRLDLHDQHSGIDTRTAAAALEQQTAAPAGYLPNSSASPMPAPSMAPRAMWYYESAGQTFGPVATDVILHMLASGQLHRTSLVWCEGMPDWTPVGRVPQLVGGGVA